MINKKAFFEKGCELLCHLVVGFYVCGYIPLHAPYNVLHAQGGVDSILPIHVGVQATVHEVYSILYTHILLIISIGYNANA